MSSQGAPPIRKGPSKLLVPLVLVVGITVGVLLSVIVPVPYGPGPFGFSNELRTLLIIHTVLSTVSVALLVAIVFVYLRIYSETGARFALGILVVMFALLLQSLFQYPLFLGHVGSFSLGFGPYLSSADVFTIAAYTILLYLSLE